MNKIKKFFDYNKEKELTISAKGFPAILFVTIICFGIAHILAFLNITSLSIISFIITFILNIEYSQHIVTDIGYIFAMIEFIIFEIYMIKIENKYKEDCHDDSPQTENK